MCGRCGRSGQSGFMPVGEFLVCVECLRPDDVEADWSKPVGGAIGIVEIAL